jgi:hypothetical protein
MDAVAEEVKRVLFETVGRENLETKGFSLDFIIEELIDAARTSAPRRCDVCGKDSDHLECPKCAAVGWSEY